jgi:outer membrane protein OmpA-like peptidoglycan-associated protein
MTRQHPNTALRGIRGTLTASAVAITAGLLLTVPADAQQRALGSTNGVVVDLSVLGGGGAPARFPGGTGPAIVSNDGFTLFPPVQKPVSRLEGPLANRSIALTAPTARSAPPARQASTAPVTAPAAAPKPPAAAEPAPAMAAATPPAPEPPAPAAPATPAATAPATPAAPEVTPPPAPAAPTSTPSADSPPPPPTQTAAVPPVSVSDGDETRIIFDAGSANLTDVAKAELDALARTLKSDSGVRVQLQAYAAGTDESAPDARRLSLSRALKVRSHLIDQGVRSTRMDVRALGVKAEGGPADRVDAVIVRR